MYVIHSGHTPHCLNTKNFDTLKLFVSTRSSRIDDSSSYEEELYGPRHKKTTPLLKKLAVYITQISKFFSVCHSYLYS